MLNLKSFFICIRLIFYILSGMKNTSMYCYILSRKCNYFAYLLFLLIAQKQMMKYTSVEKKGFHEMKSNCEYMKCL